LVLDEFSSHLFVRELTHFLFQDYYTAAGLFDGGFVLQFAMHQIRENESFSSCNVITLAATRSTLTGSEAI
jgi:hypothetical protein